MNKLIGLILRQQNVHLDPFPNPWQKYVKINVRKPVPVAEWCKEWVCGRSSAEIVGSNPIGVMNICLLWVLCVVR